ncbi:MAG: response regulator [candidate division NC10 bacterium]|nr:response regulator [candidate division NC10 bacterium]
MQARVLVVEDDTEVRSLLAWHLRRQGCTVEEAEDGVEALSVIARSVPDVIITDMAMPRLDGLGLLKAMREKDPDLPVIILTGHGSLENAIQALREGGLFDYLMKPLSDVTLLEVAVGRALEVRRLRALAREVDQVAAMRELARTAADRILNPLNVVALSLATLRRDEISPEARAHAVEKIERAIEAITQVVHRMVTIQRYAPREVTRSLREIDLEGARSPEQDAH